MLRLREKELTLVTVLQQQAWVKKELFRGLKTLLMQSKDGQITEPLSISAGLDYPGIGPMHANLYKTGRGSLSQLTIMKLWIGGLNLSISRGHNSCN